MIEKQKWLRAPCLVSPKGPKSIYKICHVHPFQAKILTVAAKLKVLAPPRQHNVPPAQLVICVWATK